MAEDLTIPVSPENTVPEEKPQKNFFRDFFGVIFDPAKAFKNILANGYWLTIFIVAILVMAGFTQVFHNQLVNMSIESMEAKENVNPQQLEATKAFFENETLARSIFLVQTIITQVLIILVYSVLFFFISSIIFGGTAKFKQVWVVTCWSSVIFIVDFLIKSPLVYFKDDFTAGLNLGIIFSPDSMGEKLHNALSAVDLFGIWHLTVAGIGLAIAYKFTNKRGITISFIVWLVFTAIAASVAYFS